MAYCCACEICPTRIPEPNPLPRCAQMLSTTTKRRDTFTAASAAPAPTRSKSEPSPEEKNGSHTNGNPTQRDTKRIACREMRLIQRSRARQRQWYSLRGQWKVACATYTPCLSTIHCMCVVSSLMHKKLRCLLTRPHSNTSSETRNRATAQARTTYILCT